MIQNTSRLYQFSHILGVPVAFFFDDMPSEALGKTPKSAISGMSDNDQSALDQDPMSRQETLELVRAYYRIQDPKVRKKLYELLRSMANLPDS